MYPEEEGKDYDDTLDPETQREEYFEGLTHQEVFDEIDRIEYEIRMEDLYGGWEEGRYYGF